MYFVKALTKGLICFALALATMSGCGGGSLSSIQSNPEVLRNLDRTSTVAGTDANNNRVRDDIESFIAASNLTSVAKAGALELARAMQATLTGATSRDDAMERAQELGDAVSDWTLVQANRPELVSELQSLTLNTQTRIDAYLAFLERIDGGVLTYDNFAGAPRSGDGCEGGGYSVFYINGVGASQSAAEVSRAQLQALIGPQFEGERVAFRYLHNQTHWYVRDVLEATLQLINEQIGGRLEFLFAILSGTNALLERLISLWEPSIPQLRSIVGQIRATVLNRTATFVGQEVQLTEQQLANFSSEVYNRLSSGDRVLIVAHSQGNLFANEMIRRIRPTLTSESLGVVHIATPSSITYGSHVTYENDLVIKIVPGSAAANFAVFDVIVTVSNDGRYVANLGNVRSQSQLEFLHNGGRRTIPK